MSAGSRSVTHTEKRQKPMGPGTLTNDLKRVLEVVKVHGHAKFHQGKCGGSWVINSALDFGQLRTLIANISGMDQGIDKRKTALGKRFFSAFDKYNLINLGH